MHSDIYKTKKLSPNFQQSLSNGNLFLQFWYFHRMIRIVTYRNSTSKFQNPVKYDLWNWFSQNEGNVLARMNLPGWEKWKVTPLDLKTLRSYCVSTLLKNRNVKFPINHVVNDVFWDLFVSSWRHLLVMARKRPLSKWKVFSVLCYFII